MPLKFYFQMWLCEDVVAIVKTIDSAVVSHIDEADYKVFKSSKNDSETCHEVK